MVWDTTRAFPPARACLFCYGLTGITFLGDPSAGSGLPRGTMVYANMPIPLQVVFILSFEPRLEKTGLRGFRPGPTQTSLYSHRRKLES